MTVRKLAALLLALVMSMAFMPAMALATEDLPVETDDIEDVHTHGDGCDHAADVVALEEEYAAQPQSLNHTHTYGIQRRLGDFSCNDSSHCSNCIHTSYAWECGICNALHEYSSKYDKGPHNWAHQYANFYYCTKCGVRREM